MFSPVADDRDHAAGIGYRRQAIGKLAVSTDRSNWPAGTPAAHQTASNSSSKVATSLVACPACEPDALVAVEIAMSFCSGCAGLRSSVITRSGAGAGL